ncbi:hypothetical protein [Vibrio sp. D431a]|nr:hypothetical protein [Vibrio sp. D431a]
MIEIITNPIFIISVLASIIVGTFIGASIGIKLIQKNSGKL